MVMIYENICAHAFRGRRPTDVAGDGLEASNEDFFDTALKRSNTSHLGKKKIY